MHKNLIIMAAGVSSRMKDSFLQDSSLSEVEHLSKTLIGLGKNKRPLLLYLLDHARESGYSELFLVVGERYEAFKSIFGDLISNNDYGGMKIHYVIQSIQENRSKPLGTADAVFQALVQHPQLRESTFTICNSDNLYSIEAFKALQDDDHRNAMIRYDRNGLQFDKEKIFKFAVLEIDVEGYLTDIKEKPTSLDIGKTQWVSMNLFKLYGPEVYPYLRDCPLDPIRNEKELPTALLNLCSENDRAIFTIPRSEHVPDLTRKEDIDTFNDFLNDL